jgi:hypothetical protein
MRLPDGWIPLTPPGHTAPGTVGAVHGDPLDDSTWWGFGFLLVDGASVLDPAEIGETTWGTKRPWPSSYLDYLAALPDVRVVRGPSLVMVGGLAGREMTVLTPAMHPTIYLKGDTNWIGGGPTGIDPAFKRKVIELTVQGRSVLMEYDDLPDLFDEHVKQVDAILGTIEFD